MAKKELDKPSKPQEDWMQRKWRPLMAMMYMTVCFFDFVVFPIMWTIVQFWETQAANDAFRQWQPLTLSGAGLFHMAMGAVLGVTAWSRGQEKIAGAAANTPASTPGMPNTSNSFTPSPVTNTGNWTQQPTTFASPNNGFSNTVQNNFAPAEIAMGYGGRKAPPPVTDYPER